MAGERDGHAPYATVAMKERLFRQVGVYDFGVARANQPVRLHDRNDRAVARAIAIGVVLEVRLEDRLQHDLDGGLNHPVRIVGMPRGRSPPPGFGIVTRRAGSARYDQRRLAQIGMASPVP